MKHSYILTILLLHFTMLLSAQNFLLPVKTNGYHIAANYSHLNNDYVQGNLLSLNAGYTNKGRFTTSLSIGREVDKYTNFQQNTAKLTSYLLGVGVGYMLLKQEQHHTILSLSVDAGYQFNNLNYGTSGYNENFHTILYGLSVNRNFHFPNQFSISPSFGIGRGYSRYADEPNFPYYNYQLLFKFGNFYLAPTLQVANDNSYLTAIAGLSIPLASYRKD